MINEIMITRENYEIFLIDLLEGNLPEGLEKELQDFLVENPDLVPDDDLPGLSLYLKDEVFPSKDDIKKGATGSVITGGNFEQFCIAWKEGDLNEEMDEMFRIFLSRNRGLELTASVYDRLTLQSDKSVVYPDKQKLRRKPVKVLPVNFKRSVVYRALSVAASVAVLLSASMFLMNELKDEPAGFTAEQTTTGNPDPAEPANPVTGTAGDRSDIINLGSGNTEPEPEPVPVPVKPVSSKLPGSYEGSAGSMNPGLKEEVLREPVLLPAAENTGNAWVMVRSETEPSGTSGQELLAMSQLMRPYEPEDRKIDPEGLLAGVITFVSRNLENETDRDRLSIWDLADAGFKSINFVAGTQFGLTREFDENGELVSTEFSSPVFGFQRTSSGNGD